MSKLTIIKPEVNKPDFTEDPKIVNALTAIENWANGLVGNGSGIEEKELTAALQAKINATGFGAIRGRINKGTSSVGSGFTLVKIATGVYEVGFSLALATFPIISLTIEGSAPELVYAKIKEVKGPPYSGFVIDVWEKESSVDAIVHFVAVG